MRRKYELTDVIESESISDYFSRVQDLINSMKANGETIIDTQNVEKKNRTLTEKFDYVVAAIQESKAVENMTIEDIEGSLQIHKKRMKERTMGKVEVSTSEN